MGSGEAIAWSTTQSMTNRAPAPPGSSAHAPNAVRSGTGRERGTCRIQNAIRLLNKRGQKNLAALPRPGTYVMPPLVLSSDGMTGFPCSSLIGAMSNNASIRATVMKTSSSAKCCPGQDLEGFGISMSIRME